MSEENGTAALQTDVLDAMGAGTGEPDTLAADDARAALDVVSGPDGLAAFGRFGELAVWWAGVRGDARTAPPGQVLLVGAAPGVAGRRPGAAVVDLPSGDVDEALEWGRATADDAADRGVELIVVSVADVTATRAVAAELLGLDAVEASGWPLDRGLSDEEWMDEVVGLRDRLRRLHGLRGRPGDLLRVLGAPQLAAAAALLVQAAVRRTPALLDGAGAAAAALLARRTSYVMNEWWQAAQQTDLPMHERTLGSLGLTAVVQLGISVEDGTAALAALAVLDQAAMLLTSAAAGPKDQPYPDDDTL
ncbi:MAG TPA: nicotinate-nucleotide--dimethylbenzimidazole phosphoribosyltransferase [Kineosporiaceae bacterium]